MAATSPPATSTSVPMALFTTDACPNISQSLEVLFQTPEALNFFAFASARQRAEQCARHLCGMPPLWEANPGPPSPKRMKMQKEIRIFAGGCYDLMHAGHYNALRQAKATFLKEGYERVHLVAGVCSDAAIAANKGPPVVPHSERVEIVKACKWVDEVAADLPYGQPAQLFDDLRIDFTVLGDDHAPGGSLYEQAMRTGKLRIVKRTEGMSTTELIGRLMTLSRKHQIKSGKDPKGLVSELDSENKGATKPVLLPTIGRIVDFRGQAEAPAGHRVVYVPGVWDLFHVGHVRFLQQAAKHGDFVLVGALGDDDVNKRVGRNFPLQTLHERALSLLSCRHVSDVLLGSPWKITQDMIKTMNISVVCHGNTDFWDANRLDCDGLGDALELPRKLNMLVKIDSGCDVTVYTMADRIWQHAEEYTIRQKKKEEEAKKYDEKKAFVAEK